MKPRIVMTSTTGWDYPYFKRIVESVELKNPVIKTGWCWNGNYKIIIEWDES